MREAILVINLLPWMRGIIGHDVGGHNAVLLGARAVHDLRCVATIAHALKALADLLAFLHVLPVLAHTAQGLMELLQRHAISGGDVFDLQIVTTMQANGVERI